MDCPHCGTPNVGSARFCLHCGSRLRADDDVGFDGTIGLAEPWPGFDADARGRAEPTLGSDSAWQRAGSAWPAAARGVQSPFELYALAVGEVNQERYLVRFAQFDQQGGASMGWHWPAFFVTFYWIIYRKLWLAALGYLVVPSLVAVGLMAAMSRLGSDAVGWGFGLYLLLIFLLPPLFADGLYYRACKRRIDAVLAGGRDADAQRAQLLRRGGTSHAAVVTLLLLVPPVVIGGLAAIALIAYP
jgi:hypothetical protein